MGNCVLSWRNFADQATLSGGSWASTMPLANLLDPTLGVKARSVDDATASTQFDADLASSTGVGLFGLVGHNLSAGASFRLRASDTAGDFTTSPLYDSGTVSVWGSAYLASDVPWESDGWWLGVITFTGLEAGGTAFIHILPTETAARYWRLEIFDTANSDGYVEAGRLFAGQAWRPTVNFNFGAALGYIDDSVIETALAGSEYFDVRPVRRTAALRFEALTDAEAWTQMLDMQRLRGITGEVLFLWDPDDPAYTLQRSFLGRQEQLNPIEAARYGANALALKLRELI
jgi:hypothetical protein